MGALSDVPAELAIEPGAVLDSLFEQADFGLALLDADLRFVRVNEVLARINRRPVAEHLGRPMSEVLPELSADVVEICRNVMEERRSATGVRVSGPDSEGGAPRSFDCAYHPVLVHGAAAGVWLTVTEVTGELHARQRADSAAADLATEQGILREVISSAPAPMAVMSGEELTFTHVNARAQEMLGNEDAIGRPAAEVFPAGAELADELRESVLVRGETAWVKEVPVGDRFWTFSCGPIPGPDGAAGVLAVGQETTQETTRSRQLEAELADEHRISTQLQVSLMPEQLPAIPGIDIASGFRPAGDGHEIGGDFYDVFEINEGCWMVVLGDVCGKGAEAAALTALARYTLRATAIREGAEPATLLGQLNTAILSQRDDMRFLSAVCLFLDLDPDDGSVATARVCVAGHLPPFLVHQSGAVEELEGGAGPVLGVWEDPELVEQHVRLGPGDRMVLYTDGVLDADPDSELTESDLAAILSHMGECDAAATVAGVEREVVGTGEPRDDMAVLVVRVP